MISASSSRAAGMSSGDEVEARIWAMKLRPESGTLPFDLTFSVSLANTYPGSSQVAAGRVDVELAGEEWTGSWTVALPASGSFVGQNLFSPVVDDVTPAPYIHPPCQAAVHGEHQTCLVTGLLTTLIIFSGMVILSCLLLLALFSLLLCASAIRRMEIRYESS